MKQAFASTILITAFVTFGCKKKVTSSTEAITGVEDGVKKALSLIVVRNSFPQMIPSYGRLDYAKLNELTRTYLFAPVQCLDSPAISATAAANKLEDLSLTGNVFVNEHRELISYVGRTPETGEVKRHPCAILGGRLLGFSSFYDAFTASDVLMASNLKGPSEMAQAAMQFSLAQTIYLAARGPTIEGEDANVTPRAIQVIIEMAKTYTDDEIPTNFAASFLEKDTEYNPCNQSTPNSRLAIELRNKNYFCEPSSDNPKIKNYRAGLNGEKFTAFKNILLNGIEIRFKFLHGTSPTEFPGRVWDVLTSARPLSQMMNQNSADVAEYFLGKRNDLDQIRNQTAISQKPTIVSLALGPRGRGYVQGQPQKNPTGNDTNFFKKLPGTTGYGNSTGSTGSISGGTGTRGRPGGTSTTGTGTGGSPTGGGTGSSPGGQGGAPQANAFPTDPNQVYKRPTNPGAGNIPAPAVDRKPELTPQNPPTKLKNGNLVYDNGNGVTVLQSPNKNLETQLTDDARKTIAAKYKLDPNDLTPPHLNIWSDVQQGVSTTPEALDIQSRFGNQYYVYQASRGAEDQQLTQQYLMTPKSGAGPSAMIYSFSDLKGGDQKYKVASPITNYNGFAIPTDSEAIIKGYKKSTSGAITDAKAGDVELNKRMSELGKVTKDTTWDEMEAYYVNADKLKTDTDKYLKTTQDELARNKVALEEDNAARVQGLKSAYMDTNQTLETCMNSVKCRIQEPLQQSPQNEAAKSAVLDDSWDEE